MSWQLHLIMLTWGWLSIIDFINYRLIKCYKISILIRNQLRFSSIFTFDHTDIQYYIYNFFIPKNSFTIFINIITLYKTMSRVQKSGLKMLYIRCTYTVNFVEISLWVVGNLIFVTEIWTLISFALIWLMLNIKY